MDIHELVSNVERVCGRRGIKLTPACVQSGAGKNLIGDIREGKSVSLQRIYLLAQYLDVTVSELIGEIPRFPEPLTDEEATLLDNFRELNEEGREKASEYVRDISESGRYIKTRQPSLGKKEA